MSDETEDGQLTDFYVSVAVNMPYGAGHWVVAASSEDEARKLAFELTPEGRWSFIYRRLEDLHELDRTCHGRLA